MFAVADIIKAFEQQAARIGPRFFELSAQLPASGRADTPIAATPNMTVLLKCYASGGENALHGHSNEDHTFVVLQGEATFHGPGGEEKVVGALGGVLLPHGSLYRFISTGEQTLVMLRIGCAVSPGLDVYARVGQDGKPMAGDSAENKQGRLQLTEEWFTPKSFAN
ncbi:cupin domain-containing protein [Caenimonas aquaedulcis]|uniref:Cupin domain-containing protein n=1 Tax=Caenimonas aquaedulcis TaxID=2793270 RepID=A0A931MJ07_9BURK|nr:cupin domain-containing protein [Caenimonas aquaedulcis]MBG9390587.1 cupin domain-containing protein [Caenimonas aquaedulcis]